MAIVSLCRPANCSLLTISRGFPSIPATNEEWPGSLLIVGGSGNLGTVLRAGWPSQGPIPARWQARGDRGGGWLRFAPLDDPRAFAKAAEGARAILNLAGVVRGDGGALAANTTLAQAAVGAARASGVPRVLVASSAAVYGGSAERLAETTWCHPQTPYGHAKLAMEQAIDRERDRSGGPEICVLRIGNVAGADQLLGQRPADGRRQLALAADGRPPRRSYLGPGALARAIAGLAVAPSPLPPVLNLSSLRAVGMDDLLGRAGIDWLPVAADPPPLARVELDCGLAAGFLPQGALDQDAAAIVADWRAVCAGSVR